MKSKLLGAIPAGFAWSLFGSTMTWFDELQDRLNALLAQDTEYDASDPIQLAAALSQQLRARDRTTQLAEFRESAGMLGIPLNSNERDESD